jgi:hypothetical protein
MYNPQQPFGQNPPQGNLVSNANAPPPSGALGISEPTVILFDGKEYRAKHTGNSGPVNPNAINGKIIKVEYKNGNFGPFVVFYLQYEDGFITRLQQIRNMKIPNNDVGLFLTSCNIRDTNQLPSLIGHACTVQVRYQMNKDRTYKTVPNSNPQGYYLTFAFVSGIQTPQMVQTPLPTIAAVIPHAGVDLKECPICHQNTNGAEALIAHLKTH